MKPFVPETWTPDTPVWWMSLNDVKMTGVVLTATGALAEAQAEGKSRNVRPVRGDDGQIYILDVVRLRAR